ncbi:hypothetical protein BH20CHL4_BH20CHL4_09500 [soil metagenome]
MDPENDLAADEKTNVSKPIILIGVLIAAIAAIAIGWVLLNQDDEEPVSANEIEELDLAAPLFRSDGPADLLHAVVSPVQEGGNSLTFRVTSSSSGDDPETIPVEAMQATIESLQGEVGARAITLQANEDGSYQSADPLQLSDGWWELTVAVTRGGEEPRETRFYLLTPDPNVNGFDAVPDHDSSSEAEAFFQAGIDQWAGMHSLTYIERLTSGTGTVSVSQREVTDGAGGNPAGFHLTAAEYEMITIGNQTWMRQAGGDWIERTTVSMYPPSEWPDLYTGATGFVLGKTVDVNDRATQVVSFYVPPTDKLVAAWYTWWIDIETGYVIREAMISTLHYMVYEFGEFEQAVVLEPPITGATPVASPLPGPVASPAPA